MSVKFPYRIILFAIVLFISCTNDRDKKILALYNPSGKNTKVLEQVRQLVSENKTVIDTTSNVLVITEDSLKNYSSLLVIDYPVDTFNYRQQPDLQRFVEAGGSVSIYSDSKGAVINWPWMNKLADSLRSTDVNEIVANLNSGNRPDYSNVTTLRVPEENRFVVEVLDTYMYEPMEMVIFKDGRILYVERRGDIKIYDPKTKKSKVTAKFDVSITGNYEDGILGVTLDPDFDKNNWIYINYSPAGK